MLRKVRRWYRHWRRLCCACGRPLRIEIHTCSPCLVRLCRQVGLLDRLTSDRLESRIDQ